MSDRQDYDDYEVGYKRPPKHSQFKPGQSGNRKGRGAGTKNLKTDLLEEFAEKITVREGDRQIKITKQRALIKSQMARGLKGNDKAAGKLWEIYLRVIGIEIDAADAGTPLSAEEQAVLNNLEARILRKAGIAERHAPEKRKKP